VFIWLTLESLQTELFAVDVLDKYLHPNDEYNIIKDTVVLHLCVLPDAVNSRPLSIVLSKDIDLKINITWQTTRSIHGPIRNQVSRTHM